jgi:D-alanyl-D-alanine dipeptidase
LDPALNILGDLAVIPAPFFSAERTAWARKHSRGFQTIDLATLKDASDAPVGYGTGRARRCPEGFDPLSVTRAGILV